MNLKKQRTRLLAAFEQRFGGGARPRAALAPGRVNLIGEHTDYNGGLVLPMAIDRHTVALFRPNGTDSFRVHALGLNSSDEFGVSKISASKDSAKQWTHYVRGTAWALAEEGVRLRGGDLLIDSDLPSGAGLSSSAALEISTGLAFLALAGVKLDAQKLALCGQRAEHRFAGVRCGIMDQTVVARAKAGHALLLDCGNFEIRHIPIKLKGLSFAIFDTGVRHKLAASEYNKRRAECEHAAKILGVKTLRDATLETQLKHLGKLEPVEERRVRHIGTENARVVQFAAALERGDAAELGYLLKASHMSLMQDYEVSCAELDDLVFELVSPCCDKEPCAGARQKFMRGRHHLVDWNAGLHQANSFKLSAGAMTKNSGPDAIPNMRCPPTSRSSPSSTRS